MSKVRWGILSTARIGTSKVIPAMQAGEYSEVAGIASRSLPSAREAAAPLGIPQAYGTYEDLLADPGIDAVYIPLPNHLHVPWSIKALEAGKHVLCEKPIGLDAAEAETLLEAARAHPHLKVMEAFMYRMHPQWQRTRALVQEGAIGEVRAVQSFFSFFNDDPGNIRNSAEYGGGALMDVGCYCVSLARFLFDAEPERAESVMDIDADFGVDRLTSALLDFGEGRTSTFTCATQLARYQRVHVVGTEGAIEIEIPFNAPPDQACRIFHQQDGNTEEIAFDACDQYTIQGDLFSRAILEDTAVPTPLEDAVANMRVIDAIRASALAGE
ncbi:MAG: Gfo/Idh/MocA family protein [Rhodothermales bacterium]